MNGLCAGFIGLGLIGGSIAQALKYYYPDIHILAHTRSQKTLDYALSNGIIDEACEPVLHLLPAITSFYVHRWKTTFPTCLS